MSYGFFGGEDAHAGESSTAIVDEILHSEKGYARGPERALLSALLFDGVQAYINFACSQVSGERARPRYREAYHWVHNKGNDYIFSFDNVCEALGIDPHYLRYGLANACNSRGSEWKRSRRNF